MIRDDAPGSGAGLARRAGGVRRCGYALAGRGSFLPAYIRTIGIPQFTNTTPYYELEQVFTERVRSEFIGRGQVQGPAPADRRRRGPERRDPRDDHHAGQLHRSAAGHAAT